MISFLYVAVVYGLSDVNLYRVFHVFVTFLIAKIKFKQCDEQQTIPPISTK